MRMNPGMQLARRATPRARPVLLAWAALALLAACQPRTSMPEHAPVAAAPAEGRPYQIDASASRFEFRLHADGPLASVGHTHVISARELAGTIWLQSPPGRSSCALAMPVASLVVDDPGERAAAGGEFAEPLDADARAGTRDHMLGGKQLDAAHFPTVSLQCRAIHVAGDSATVELAVTLRGRETVLQVPAKWRQHGATLEAEGEFDFRQSALGLEPYSLLFGALRVADSIHARFTLRARVPG